jgi:hypothetical protein
LFLRRRYSYDEVVSLSEVFYLRSWVIVHISNEVLYRI